MRFALAVVAICLVFAHVSTEDANGHDTTGWKPLVSIGELAPFGTDTGGYTDAWGSGQYAFLGTLDAGVAIIDLSVPKLPAHVSTYDSLALSSYEDVKVYGDIGYFAGSSGVHIVDVSNPQQPTMLSQIDSANGGFDKVQNVFIRDELLFAVNAEDSNIKVFDITNATSPSWLRNIETNDLTGIWDVTVVDDRLYAAGLGGVFGEGATYVYDIGDIRTRNPRRISKLVTGANTASAWPSGDGQYLVTTQRDVGGSLSLWNISRLSFPSLVGTATAATYGIASYSAGPVFVDDMIVYAAWYESGVQVLDLDSLDNTGAPARIGAFDTSLGSSPLDGFVGNRSVFTGLGSDTILLSDTEFGLYVVDATDVLPSVPDPRIADLNSDGQLTVDDINLLAERIVAGGFSIEFDINGDAIVNIDDVDAWLTLVGTANVGNPFRRGDANLDGIVDASDLNDLALNWLKNVSEWSRGDFTVNGTVDAADLNALGINWLSSAAEPAPVPESSGFTLCVEVVCLLGLLGHRRGL